MDIGLQGSYFCVNYHALPPPSIAITAMRTAMP
jgi:hypothetical protein